MILFVSCIGISVKFRHKSVCSTSGNRLFPLQIRIMMCLCPDITRSCLLERSLDLLRRNMVQERYMEIMELTSFEINK